MDEEEISQLTPSVRIFTELRNVIEQDRERPLDDKATFVDIVGALEILKHEVLEELRERDAEDQEEESP